MTWGNSNQSKRLGYTTKDHMQYLDSNRTLFIITVCMFAGMIAVFSLA